MKPYKNIKRGGKTYSEHRWVWEQEYGPIPSGYVVHHKNEDKRDNRLENLELMTHEEHSRHHNDKHPRVKGCVVCGSQYGPRATKRETSQTCSRKCFQELCRIRASERKRPERKALVELARRLVADGHQQGAVADYMGIPRSTMSHWINRRTW